MRLIVSCLAGLAAAAAAPAAHADPLTTAAYQLKAHDGRTIQQADCLSDQPAVQTSFCRFLVARDDRSTGSATLQWLRDARTLGAATVVFTEAGDGFTGTTTYTVPAGDTSSYTVTSAGSYPPSTVTKTSRYEITSIDAQAADIDCISGRNPAAVQHGPYGPFCVVNAMRPASPMPAASSTKRHRTHRAHRHKVA